MEADFHPTKEQGQPITVVPAGALRRSGDHGHKTYRDFRSMTLRHYLSVILPFGQPVVLDQRAPDFRCLALRHRLSADWLLSAVWLSWPHENINVTLDP